LNLTVATDFFEATRCIYEGANAAQSGVKSGTIDPLRVAVVRGRVLDTDGQPIEGARVRILNRPEFGETRSRNDGLYDLALNGGGPVALTFEAEGYLRLQRRSATEWRRFSVFPDVVLTPASEAAEPLRPEDLSAPALVSGPTQTDQSGARRQRVLFRPETVPSAKFEDGTEQILEEVTLRITEFTVGERGPAAMLGDLPPTSGYTYAVDISVEEAEELGATSVVFDPPLPTYVENFLEFPAGTAVPTGYYDPARDVWEATDSGLVIDVVDEVEGIASIDANGDGVAESDEELKELGIDESERRVLAATYEPGTSLWRTPLPHLSIWDHNWPFSPPDDATAPDGDVEQSGPDDCRRQVSGSIIGCEDQSLGEEFDLAGTPHRLRYQSERMPGRKDRNSLSLTIDASSIPPSATALVIEVDVLGELFSERFELPPPATWTFDWDGKDPYGRNWQGRQEARVRFGYAYDGVYERTSRFGVSGDGVAITGDRARSEVVLWSSWSGPVGGFNLSATGLGGLSFDVHHVLDARGGVLYQGDGTQRTAELAGGVIDRIAGTGTSGFSGDLGPALDGRLNSPHGAVVRPDGAMLIADELNNRVRIILPDGTIDTFAGTGLTSPLGDGGPALEAAISAPLGLALGPDGSLYIGERGTNRIRRVNPQGIISTFAGGGTPEDGVGDGGPALDARFEEPHSLAFGPDGSLYVADNEGNRIRAITPEGRVLTVAGTGEASSTGDGGRATEATLDSPLGIVVGFDGSLFVTEFDGNRVRRIRPDGRIETIAGTGESGFSGDGGLATLARLRQPHSIALGLDGSLYITDEGNRRVRRIRQDGTILTVAGDGGSSSDGDGGSPLAAGFDQPRVVYHHIDGTLWILDYSDSIVRRIRPPFPSLLIGETLIGSKDGTEAFVFDADGRHLRTVDALLGSTVWSFEYTTPGTLAKVTDAWGLSTSVDRDSQGKARAIVGPYGARTDVALDENCFLSTLENPLGEEIELEFSEDGLLTGLVEPLGDRHEFSYDAMGRLIADLSPTGLQQTLERESTTSGTVVTLSKNGARGERHETQTGAAPTDRVRLFTDAAGVQSTLTSTASGATLTTPTIQRTTTYSGDPRFGTMAPYAATDRIDWQSGTRTDITRTRIAVPSSGDPLALTSFEERVTVNGALTVSHLNRADRTLVRTSPSGRTQTVTFDERGLPLLAQSGSLDPIQFNYDANGRLVASGFDSAKFLFTYGADGVALSNTNPLGETVAYARDALGRVELQSNADGTEYSFAFDENGQLALVGVSEGVTHSFNYEPGGLFARYSPPALSGLTGDSWTADYNEFEDLVGSGLDGDPAAIEFEYDDAGRLSAVLSAGANSQFAYETVGGRLATASTDVITQAHAYSGALLDRVTSSGLLTGTIDLGFDDNVRLSSLATTGGTTIDYEYDADGLLTAVEGLSLVRDAANGFVTGTSLGVVVDSTSHSSRGEPTLYAATIDANAAYSYQDTLDALGRVIARTETILGETHAFGYAYDAAGRLVEVRRDGAVAEQYGYDARGNRISGTNSAGSTAVTYDGQDRVLTHGAASYEYAPSGQLKRRTSGSEVTNYAYNKLGGLLAVELPSGKRVETIIDAFGRQVGRKVDGALTHRLLYGADGSPLADRGPSGSSTVAQYVFGSRLNTPEFIVEGSIVYRVLVDRIGSVRLVVNASDGTIVQRLDYDSFGRILTDTNPGFQPFGFAGGLSDPDTGLVRFGARDYDPELGRWTAKDPILFAGQQANLYVYVGNDPVNFVDFTGHEPVSATVAGLTILGTGLAGGLAAVYLSDKPNLGDFAFGFSTGIISGVALISGSLPLAIVGSGFGVAVQTNGFTDFPGFIGSAASTVGEGVCNALGGPAGPFIGPFCGEALGKAVNECRE